MTAVYVSIIWAVPALALILGFLWVQYKKENPLTQELEDLKATVAGMQMRYTAVERDLTNLTKAVVQQPAKMVRF